MVSLSKSMVSHSKSMVSFSKSIVCLGKLMISLSKSMVSLSKSMISLSKSMVSLGKSMVSLGTSGFRTDVLQRRVAGKPIVSQNASKPKGGLCRGLCRGCAGVVQTISHPGPISEEFLALKRYFVRSGNMGGATRTRTVENHANSLDLHGFGCRGQTRGPIVIVNHRNPRHWHCLGGGVGAVGGLTVIQSPALFSRLYDGILDWL